LKFSHRRRFSGESQPFRGGGGICGGVGLSPGVGEIVGRAGAGLSSRIAIASGLPRLEVDARIDPDIHQVRQDPDDQTDQAEGE
jgi:hypothetical protein